MTVTSLLIQALISKWVWYLTVCLRTSISPHVSSHICFGVCPQISIMLGGGFKSERLRVNLRLVINRLKLLEKKKCELDALLTCKELLKVDLFMIWIAFHFLSSELAELAQKARKEIADYLSAGKDERARIRVEHIIREDYLVEAMEILELYCDLLLTRFGLIQSMK